MAKVFYFLLTTRMDMGKLDWSRSVGLPVEARGSSSILLEPGSHGFALSARFGNTPESLSGVYSYAVRPDWAESQGKVSLAGPSEDEEIVSHRIACPGMSVLESMTLVQDVVGQCGLQWFHPDEFTILARNEATATYVWLQCFVGSENYETELVIQLWHGALETFRAICEVVEERVTRG
jgi:BR serine/threonine kinase